MSPESVVIQLRMAEFRLVSEIAPVPLALSHPVATTIVIQPLIGLDIRARLVFTGRVIAVVTEIFPVVVLPIVSKLAVILPISAVVKPRLLESSAPPRLTPAPSVWTSTFPPVVAFTVPVRFTLLAVRVIRPAAVEILLVTTRLLPVRLMPPVPFVESAAPTVILLAVLLVISERLPLAGRLMAAVTAILPVLLLPIVTRLAVIWPSSARDKPRLAEVSVPSPRFTPAPSVWINTFPPVVAFTVPVRFTLLAVMVIRPAAVEILLVTTRLLPVRLMPPVPFVESAAPTVILLAVLPVISERLPLSGRLMAAVTAILPVLLLPIVTRLAVIWPSSARDKPRLAEVSVPSPRFTPAPSVWISTRPAVVAFTVPERLNLLVLRVIKPPLE